VSPEEILKGLFRTMVAAAGAEVCTPPNLPPSPFGRTIALGAGKAAAAMARVVDDRWEGPLEGLVVTPYGHGLAAGRIAVAEAGHPQPDAAGREAAERILALAQAAGPEDLVLVLLSGGGSSLLTLPPPAVPLSDKQAVNRDLLRSGAPIAEINCVRKHLSAIKGGRLALAAAPARVVSLIISDAPGDDPSVIASGPTAPDPTTRQQALAVLEARGVEPPPSVAAWLADPACETPKPGEPAFARVRNRIIATPREALSAAQRWAEDQGLNVINLGHDLEGESRDLAARQAETVATLLKRGAVRRPALFLSGGETTVTVRSGGKGGRNTEFLLALAIALDGADGVYALAADTDGIDGAAEAAGAMIRPDTLERGRAKALDAAQVLENNDSHAYFAALGDLLVTGPTRTNVNDLRAILMLA